MDYQLLIEDDVAEIYDVTDEVEVTILCYSVQNAKDSNKIPYLVFMVQQNNGVFTLPKLYVENDLVNEVDLLLTNHLRSCGISLFPVPISSCIKGIINDTRERIYVLVNITPIDIEGLKRLKNDRIWFALPTEIYNQGHLLQIPFDSNVKQLFNENYNWCLLMNNGNNADIYPLPDVMYTKHSLAKGDFHLVFGASKQVVHPLTEPMYAFFRHVKDALYTKDSKSCIIRYAGFLDTKYLYLEYDEEGVLRLTDTDWNNKKSTSSSLIISYINGKPNNNYNFLTTNPYIFTSMSLHMVNAKEDIDLYDIY